MRFKRLWSLKIQTPPEAAEALAEALGDDALSVSILAPPRSKTAQIEALYAEKPDFADLTARLAVAAALHKIRAPKFHIQETPDLDWLKKVAEDFPPLPIARWIIHGAQHRKSVPDRRRGLQIDATNAFGTSEHPTTRGCLLMLDWVLKKKLLRYPRESEGPSSYKKKWMPAYAGMTRKRPRMLDMGCGSGILAMAWAKTAKGRALAVDCDADSVRIAKDNARANGLSGKIRVARGNGYTGSAHRKAPYDLIMANIFAKPLAHMAKDLRRELRPSGVAILSGLLAHQTNLVLAAHRMQKIYPLRIFRIGEWAVLVLRRKARPVSPDKRNSTGRPA